MKVIHINLASTWRGGERQVALLFKGLNQLGVDQLLVCLKNSALEELAKKEAWNYLAISKNPIHLFTQAKILKNLEKQGYQIIHCHESRAHTLGILTRLLWKSRQRLIIHRRVIFPIKNKISTPIKYSEKHISKIICISKAVEKSVKQSIGFKNTVFIPSMISFDKPQTYLSVLRRDFSITARFIIGYIAALTKEKDHITFLETAKKILESETNIHFVIIGDGPLKDNLLAYSKSLGISKHITFTGFIKDIPSAIQEIDLLLFTSVFEGLGSTVLDFFVAKKPVVATRSGGVEELIIDGETGYLCAVGDSEALKEKVMFLLGNPDKTQQIVNKAFKFALNFSVPTISSKTLEIYKNVL
jgi:glycosyltransferase involved in cell wall biosynthesis